MNILRDVSPQFTIYDWIEAIGRTGVITTLGVGDDFVHVNLGYILINRFMNRFGCNPFDFIFGYTHDHGFDRFVHVPKSHDA
ncbi:hypothetical protein OTG27_02090 [Peribacillus sp. AS_1]|nr:hypothetical protein [Peribacillus sp. AS_2]MCZ0870998.1 hypothetical protein [Peribacillus sp. AS_2]